MKEVKNKFSFPEEINGGENTHPSARLEKIIPQYDKVSVGTLALVDVNIEDIRRECPHFSEWIEKLEKEEIV